jgi:foldase protein PrsA
MPKAHRIIAGAATVLLAASLAACSGGGASIATVNGAPISKADFDAKLEASPTAVGVLQQMVREVLLDQYAKDNNITVSDAEIQKREDDIKANFPNGSWDQMLKSRGMTENDVHDLLKQQIIIDKAVGKDVKVTDAQIKDYFNKNHASFDTPAQVQARHILVADLATAQKVEADLKAGKDFGAEAEKYSMDPGSKEKGGELGLFRRGQMVPAFDQAAFSLPVGQISQPVHSSFGYHIIQVEKRTPDTKATLASTQERIADLLRQQQEAPLIQPFLTGLQQKANIQVSDPRFQSAFPSPPPAQPAAAPSAAAPAPSAT